MGHRPGIPAFLYLTCSTSKELLLNQHGRQSRISEKNQCREMKFADCSDYQSVTTGLMVLAPFRKVRQHSRSVKQNVYIHAYFFLGSVITCQDWLA